MNLRSSVSSLIDKMNNIYLKRILCSFTNGCFQMDIAKCYNTNTEKEHFLCAKSEVSKNGMLRMR